MQIIYTAHLIVKPDQNPPDNMVFLFNLGAPGAWIGAVLDHNVRAILIWWRFATGNWKDIEVRI
jgi:Na+-driven multidrug efflux pump